MAHTKNNNPCLAKAGLDEPIFVLRAQDALAFYMVRAWGTLLGGIVLEVPREEVIRRIAAIAEQALTELAAQPVPNRQGSVDKVGQSLELATAMCSWSERHPGKMKLPD